MSHLTLADAQMGQPRCVSRSGCVTGWQNCCFFWPLAWPRPC